MLRYTIVISRAINARYANEIPEFLGQNRLTQPTETEICLNQDTQD